MKVGVIGAGTMGQGIAKAFAQVEGYEVALCDIKPVSYTHLYRFRLIAKTLAAI